MPDFLETSVDKFIFRVATDRLYCAAGVWIAEEQGGALVRLGVTDYQQQINGDVAFVHLTPLGTALVPGDEFAEVETIKATVSFGSPVTGNIVSVNEELDLTPESVNQDPYGQGWLVLIEPTCWLADRTTLLDAEFYLSLLRSQAEEELRKS